jgi:hypothetical protein
MIMTTTESAVHERHEARGAFESPIEHQIERFPADRFIWAALGSIGLSLTLRMIDRRHDALFVGQWAPTFLLLGIFSKLVKTYRTEHDINHF